MSSSPCKVGGGKVFLIDHKLVEIHLASWSYNNLRKNI